MPPSTAQLISELGIDATMPNLKTILTRLLGSTSGGLYVQRTADYANVTAVPTDLVTGSLTTAGRDVLVMASGNLFVSNTDSAALIQNLVDDSTTATVQLYIGGVAQQYAISRRLATPALSGSVWFQFAEFPGTIFKLISGLAAGAHTFAVKGSVSVTPSGQLLQCAAASVPLLYSYALRVVEL